MPFPKKLITWPPLFWKFISVSVLFSVTVLLKAKVVPPVAWAAVKVISLPFVRVWNVLFKKSTGAQIKCRSKLRIYSAAKEQISTRVYIGLLA